MSGASAVVALVLMEWATGLAGAAAWSQTWAVVKRGHFRIVAWTTLLLAAVAALALRGVDEGPALWLALVTGAAMLLYLVRQYARSDLVTAVVGAGAAVLGAVTLGSSAAELDGWPAALAAVELIAGAVLLGAVTNGMLLGHWYLNQPGLKPWALARLTDLALVAIGVSLVLGLISAPRLANAETEGAVLGIPGFGESFSLAFYLVWVALMVFTGAVVWGVRRCIKIRSIQSATGLFYVALLSAGVAEFLLRYLMVNA